MVRRLSAGLLLSRTGDQLTTIALLWFVLDLTGSGAAVGLVLLCAGLPPVVTGRCWVACSTVGRCGGS